MPSESYKNKTIYKAQIYNIRGIRGIVHAEAAETLTTYEEDFYRGSPVFTKNKYGKGVAYYIAAEVEEGFLKEVYKEILDARNLYCVFNRDLPYGVTVTRRSNSSGKGMWFILNFNPFRVTVQLNETYRDIETQNIVDNDFELQGYECRIFEECKKE